MEQNIKYFSSYSEYLKEFFRYVKLNNLPQDSSHNILKDYQTEHLTTGQVSVAVWDPSINQVMELVWNIFGHKLLPVEHQTEEPDEFYNFFLEHQKHCLVKLTEFTVNSFSFLCYCEADVGLCNCYTFVIKKENITRAFGKIGKVMDAVYEKTFSNILIPIKYQILS